MDDSLDKWFDSSSFPPLSIYHGGKDYLVLTEPLLERLAEKEKGIDVIRVEKLEIAEVRLALDRRFPKSFTPSTDHIESSTQHCDFYWAALSLEWVFGSLRGKSYCIKRGWNFELLALYLVLNGSLSRVL